MNQVHIEFYDFEEAEAALLLALESLRKSKSDTVVIEGDKLRVSTDARVKTISVNQSFGDVSGGVSITGVSLDKLG